MDRRLFSPLHVVASVLAAFLWMGSAPAASSQEPSQESLVTLPLHDLSAFRPTGGNWQIAGDVYADLESRHHIETETGTGVLVCIPTDEARENLFTSWEHGDLTLALEFMMPQGSNSGVYLQGRYEVQLFDSWGVEHPDFGDVGGIYQRWDEDRPEGRQGYDGVPPRVNAARAPGLWQTLEIDFRAPRFDESGRKVENARFERVMLNGTVIHENVVLTGPTRAAAFEDESATGPLMIQGDHGPVALRNIRYKRYGTESVHLGDVAYRVYEGEFESLPAASSVEPTSEGTLDVFRADVVGDMQRFAVEYEGTLTVPTTGPYQLELDLGWIDEDPHFQGQSTGGGEVGIGSEAVLRHDGRVRVASSTVELQAGSHPIRIAYFKNRYGMGRAALLTVEGPDTRRRLLNDPSSLPSPRLVAPILVDHGSRPAILRHMLDRGDERRTHVASVGDPEGVHYTVDLDRGALLQVWRGPFLETTPMWHSRGYHQLALPRGSVEDMPALPAIEGAAFRRYVLDDTGRPTFEYTSGDAQITDRLEPVLEGRALRRTLRATGRFQHGVARSSRIERLPDGSYAVDDRSYLIRFAEGAEPVLRREQDEFELLAPVGDAPLTYTILW